MLRDSSNKEKTALIVVDNLECFHEGGAIPVPNAAKINPIINDLHNKTDLTIAVQEWHPENHCSFVGNTRLKDGKWEKGIWSPHGIANKSGPSGSAFHPDMDLDWAMVFRKGMKKDLDSYSAFSDEGGHTTRLDELLKSFDITTVWITGLATEYCVKATVLDARAAMFKTIVWKNGIAGMDYQDSEAALLEMAKQGAEIRTHYII